MNALMSSASHKRNSIIIEMLTTWILKLVSWEALFRVLSYPLDN